MEFKTIKTVANEAVSRNIIARVRERQTGNIQIIFIENYKGKMDQFRKEFLEANKAEYSLAWSVFAPVDESKYDEVIANEEAKWTEIKRKSCEYHKAKRDKEKEVEA